MKAIEQHTHSAPTNVPTGHDMDNAQHYAHSAPMDAPTGHDMAHMEHDHSPDGGHGGHAGHSEAMFARPFWVSLILTIPVLVYSELFQQLLGYTAPQFPG